MSLLPGIGLGTDAYPDRIARRLRAVNLTCWCAAAVAAGFAVYLGLYDWPRLWALVAVNAADAVIWAAIPLLHRFGPTVAPVAFGLSVYASNFAITALLGTDAGVYLYYMPVAALAVLFLGIGRIALAGALAATAALLHLAAHFWLPAEGPLAGADPVLVHGTYATSVVAVHALLFAIVWYGLRQTARAEAALEREYERSERLLANILPGPIAERLKGGREATIADTFEEASILFADLAGFTGRASRMPPGDLVAFLNAVFSRFDGLVEYHGLEKIKTIGDAYMVAAGLPEPHPDHAGAAADLALDMMAAAAGLAAPEGEPAAIRIGIASGPVVAGVVGTRKFAYDVWGDTVNLAARMESQGTVGRIQITDETRRLLDGRYRFEERGTIEVRGRGPLRTWFLLGPESPGEEPVEEPGTPAQPPQDPEEDAGR